MSDKQSIYLIQLIPQLVIRNPTVDQDIPYPDSIPRRPGCDDFVV